MMGKKLAMGKLCEAIALDHTTYPGDTWKLGVRYLLDNYLIVCYNKTAQDALQYWRTVFTDLSGQENQVPSEFIGSLWER